MSDDYMVCIDDRGVTTHLTQSVVYRVLDRIPDATAHMPEFVRIADDCGLCCWMFGSRFTPVELTETAQVTFEQKG